MIIVVMGVSGSGKSTVGKLLAERLSIIFIDADDFHPKENIAKMTGGIPLDDADREPWLSAMSAALQVHEKGGVVLACSALKETYRQALQQGLQEKIVWMYLKGSKEIISQRVQSRGGHFMPADLLQSQLDTLQEPPYAYCFSIDKTPEAIVEEMIRTVEH